MPSSSDEETEKLISQTTQILRTQQPISLAQRTKFTDTISVASKPKPAEVHRSTVYSRQASVPRGIKMEIAVPHQQPKPQPLYKESKALTLKRQVEERVQNKVSLQQTLKAPLLQQRRFSETLAIDHRQKPKRTQQVY